jgi:alanine racemase
VSILDEAMQLRQAGITGPILIMGTILPEEAERALELNVTPTLNSYEAARSMSNAAEKRYRGIKAHVKIDTGMGRFGTLSHKAVQYVQRLQTLDHLELEGIYTHFPVADHRQDEFTLGQIRQFREILSELAQRGIHIPLQHAANSSAILNYPQSYFNMVRPGDMLYGLYPSDKVDRGLNLKPALSWKSRILTLKQVPPGWSISYGRTFIASKEMNIGIIPLGYADGFNRHLSNTWHVLVRGRRAPVTGTVCMDQFMIDVTHIPEAMSGDEVVLIGRQGDDEITVDEMARQLDTINYEIICGISTRVPRVYVT